MDRYQVGKKKNSQKYKSRNANKLPAAAWRTLITQWVWFHNVNMRPEYWLPNVGWILSRIKPNIPVFFNNEYGVLANEIWTSSNFALKPPNVVQNRDVTSLSLLKNRVSVRNFTTCKFNVAVFKFEGTLWQNMLFLACWKSILHKWFYIFKELLCSWYISRVSIKQDSCSFGLVCTVRYFIWHMVKCPSKALHSWL